MISSWDDARGAITPMTAPASEVTNFSVDVKLTAYLVTSGKRSREEERRWRAINLSRNGFVPAQFEPVAHAAELSVKGERR